MTHEEFADNLIQGIERIKQEVKSDQKATAAYWNGDDWGSCSGIQDAQEWVDNQVRTWAVDFIKQNSDAILSEQQKQNNARLKAHDDEMASNRAAQQRIERINKGDFSA